MANQIVHQFTPLATADLIDHLCAAVDAARKAASVSPSWLRAIDNAYDYLLTTDEISYDLAAGAIRVESATEPGRFYVSNGDCQCRAFTHGAGVCWHRAAARLVRRLLEDQKRAKTAQTGDLARRIAQARIAAQNAGEKVVGAWPDGTPIIGKRDDLSRKGMGRGEPIVVSADGDDCCINMDADGWVGLNVGNLNITDSATLADVLKLRDLLNSGALEATIAAANSFLGASLPLPAPVVTVEPCINDDDTIDVARYGTLLGYDYVAGSDDTRVLGWVPFKRDKINYPGIILNDHNIIPIAQARAILRNLSAVLSDPRFLNATA